MDSTLQLFAENPIFAAVTFARDLQHLLRSVRILKADMTKMNGLLPVARALGPYASSGGAMTTLRNYFDGVEGYIKVVESCFTADCLATIGTWNAAESKEKEEKSEKKEKKAEPSGKEEKVLAAPQPQEKPDVDMSKVSRETWDVCNKCDSAYVSDPTSPLARFGKHVCRDCFAKEEKEKHTGIQSAITDAFNRNRQFVRGKRSAPDSDASSIGAGSGSNSLWGTDFKGEVQEVVCHTTRVVGQGQSFEDVHKMTEWVADFKPQKQRVNRCVRQCQDQLRTLAAPFTILLQAVDVNEFDKTPEMKSAMTDILGWRDSIGERLMGMLVISDPSVTITEYPLLPPPLEALPALVAEPAQKAEKAEKSN